MPVGKQRKEDRMKTQMFFVLLLAFGACASKHELLHQTKESSATLLKQQTESLKQSSHYSYTQQNDSAWHNYRFKLYPKGEVEFNNGSFTGQLDSIVGYGNSFKLQKIVNLRQEDSLVKDKTKVLFSNSTAKKAKLKETYKFGNTWWLLLWVLPMLIIGLFFFKRRK